MLWLFLAIQEDGASGKCLTQAQATKGTTGIRPFFVVFSLLVLGDACSC
ncbi:MAG: hypothetical protein H6658_11485 [Ardenticatenaceae bacterium]|nr:hypothetical protein [Ardenticatenaceae bacterium]